MEMGGILCYSSLYPGSKVPEIKDLLLKRSSRVILMFLSYSLSILHDTPYDKKHQWFLLNMLLKRQNRQFQLMVLAQLKRQKDLIGSSIIFDVYSLLKVANVVVANYNIQDQSDTTPEDEYAILLAILVANEELNNLEVIETQDRLEGFCSLTWPLMVRSTEMRTKKDFITQTKRCVGLLEYFNDEPMFRSAIEEWPWIKETSTKNYLYKILELYFQSSNNGKVGSICVFNIDLKAINPLVSQITLDLRTGAPQNFQSSDFKTFRDKPILQVADKQFFVVNWNFLLEKLYVGLMFDIFYKTSLKDQYVVNGIPRFDTFKSAIGKHFAQKHIAEILSQSVRNTTDVFIAGDDSRDNDPDIYFRRKKSICLMEYKDALAVKSDSFSKMKKQIDDKLAEGKGISQLAEQIKILEKNPDFFEKGLSSIYNKKKLVVYPILVVSDAAFAMPGMNDYLNRLFKEKLEKTSFYVKDLVVIEEEFFLKHYDSFAILNEDLLKVLERYYYQKFKARKKASKKIVARGLFLKQYNSFSEFNLVKRYNKKRMSMRYKNSFYSMLLEKLPESD